MVKAQERADAAGDPSLAKPFHQAVAAALKDAAPLAEGLGLTLVAGEPSGRPDVPRIIGAGG